MQQTWIQDLSKKRTSAWIPIEQHSFFRWLCSESKAGNQSLAWFWIWLDCNQSLQPLAKQLELQMKSKVKKPCKEGKRTSSTGWASIFCSKIFLSNLLLKTINSDSAESEFLPNINNLIKKICPYFQVLISHFLEVDHNCHCQCWWPAWWVYFTVELSYLQ